MTREARKTVLEEIIRELPAVLLQARQERNDSADFRLDAWYDVLQSILGRVTNIFKTKSNMAYQYEKAMAFAGKISTKNMLQHRAVFSAALGVQFNPLTEAWLMPEMQLWASQNAQLITSLQQGYADDVAKAVRETVIRGGSIRDLTEHIRDRLEPGLEKKAAFIARDQVGTLNADLTQKRQTDAGVTKYIWRTAKDERVRGDPGGMYPSAEPSHFDREGKVYEWKNPPEGGHPGEDYNCRCTAEPDFSDLLAVWGF